MCLRPQPAFMNAPLHEASTTLVQKPFKLDRVERPRTRRARGAAPGTLEVIYLGDYAASIAPNGAALARVHPELALRPSALEQVPSYATYAFVILRLKTPRRVFDRSARVAEAHRAPRRSHLVSNKHIRRPVLPHPRGPQRDAPRVRSLRPPPFLPNLFGPTT